MQTHVIFSHIAHGAKPVFNAGARKHEISDLGFEEEAAGKEKRGRKRLRGTPSDAKEDASKAVVSEEGPSVERG
tara:strand:+ start:7628 stop:7849 length:222 start_codon:yes stop_codon:yes gene_type:complete